jgi:hypothetical protein
MSSLAVLGGVLAVRGGGRVQGGEGSEVRDRGKKEGSGLVELGALIGRADHEGGGGLLERGGDRIK